MIDHLLIRWDSWNGGEVFLSKSERARLQIHPSPERFCATRSLLRQELAKRCESNPQDLDLGITAEGKPFIKNSPLHFSVSHSGPWLALGFQWDHPLGVDFEMWERAPQAKRVLARWLPTAGSLTDLDALKLWTHYEAFAKWQGVSYLKSSPPDRLPANPAPIHFEFLQAGLLTVIGVATTSPTNNG